MTKSLTTVFRSTLLLVLFSLGVVDSGVADQTLEVGDQPLEVGDQPLEVGDQPLQVDEMIVVLIDAVNVPAGQSGVIAKVPVREGMSVTVGQQLAVLDDRQARIEEEFAVTQLAIANETAANSLSIDLAKKKLAQQQQLAKQIEIAREIADRKAGNETRILASRKAEAVARNELDRATRARQQFIDSVSQSEIDSLRLSYEKKQLESEQAEFDRRIDELNARSEVASVAAQAISIERSEIEVAQAGADRSIDQLNLELQQHQVQLAKLARAQQEIVSPINGVVVQQFRRQGDWVTAGDPVVRVIRLSRLRAEGFVPLGKIHQLRSQRKVDLLIDVGEASPVQRAGRIVFIHPEVDPVNKEVRFWVEFENPKFDVLPGMRLSLRSKP